MLTITLIQFFTLYCSVAGRPAWSTFISSSAEVNTRTNATLASAYSSVLTASLRPVLPGTKDTPRHVTAVNQEKTYDRAASNSTILDIPVFNSSFVHKELREVTAKYSRATQNLEGHELSPLPNFTFLADLLGDNNSEAEVSGSTYILDLQTYGPDIAYYGKANMGTPPQAVWLDVDTGSADLWVSSHCTSCDPNKARFESNDSSTYLDTGRPFTLTYGTGNVEGTISRETIRLGELSVSGQYFGAASKESSDFADVPFIGILGMAFSSISVSREPTFMERLIRERRIDFAAFGVYLSRHQPRRSQVCIGCYDPSKYIGDVSWNPVTSQTYWSISLKNVQANGFNTAPRIVTAAIDTGTSLIYLPQDLADSLYSRIPGAKRAPQYGSGLYTYPCLDQPNVSLVFGDRSHDINLQDFNLGRTTSLGPDCVGGIIATGNDFSSGLAIIGDEFLKSWYSIYDYGKGSRVGFAKSINNR